MGEKSKKYHITDDGDIYRVNEDGSFTSMGNAEDKPSIGIVENKSEDSYNVYNTKNDKSDFKNKKPLLIALATVLLLILFAILYFSINDRKQEFTATQAKKTAYPDTILKQATEVFEGRQDSVFVSPTETKTEASGSQEASNSQSNEKIENISDYTCIDAVGQMEGVNNFFLRIPQKYDFLNSEHKQRIKKLVNNVDDVSKIEVEVDGYINQYTGTYEENIYMMNNRIECVKSYLIKCGIPAESIIRRSHDIPFMKNDSEAVYVTVMVSEAQ